MARHISQSKVLRSLSATTEGLCLIRISSFVYQCRLLITLANSLDPDQARRIVGLDQGPNGLTF